MELLMGKWILYELLKKHSEYWKAEEKIIGEVQLSVNKQKLSGKADNHGFQSMNTLKSQVGDIGIRSLLESKKGWSQGIAIVFSFGRNINGLLKHVISNSHAHTNSRKELAIMIFLSFWNTQDQN